MIPFSIHKILPDALCPPDVLGPRYHTAEAGLCQQCLAISQEPPIIPAMNQPIKRRSAFSRLRYLGVLLVFGVLLVGWLLNTPPGLLGKADALGYAVCHQIEARSFHLGDRVFPLCVRCSGMYLGALLGMVYLHLTSPRRCGLPPLKILAVLGIFVLAFGVDGVNSLLNLMPGLPSLYPPSNSLRLVTGTGMGLVLAVMLVLGFNQTAWKDWDGRPLIASWRSFLGLLGLAALLVVVVGLQNPLVLYPLALISAGTIWLILALVYTTLWLLMTRQDNRAISIKQLAFPLLVGATLALLQVIVFDVVRYALTGTWQGFQIG
jgi:uncharacterized membrane protein